MSVRDCTTFTHYGNKREYMLRSIASPYCIISKNAVESGMVFHTEKEEYIKAYSDGAIHYTSEDEYLVIYSRDGDTTIYARPVDMFFEHVDGSVKRFTKLKL